MKRKIAYLLALFVMAGIPALAQKDFRAGFIVNLQQDTLRGLINYKGDTKSALACTFKTDLAAAEQEFKPEALSGYGFTGGKVYESKAMQIVSRKVNLANKFPEEPVDGHSGRNFMEVLVRGTLSLYYLVDATAAPHFYIQKENGKLQELVLLEGYITNAETGHREFYRSKQYIGTLTLAFADCKDPELKKQTEKAVLQPFSLQSVVTRYNQCVSGKTTTVYQKPKSKIKWGLAAGFSSNHLEFGPKSYLGKGTYKGNTGFTAGAILVIPMPILNEKLSLHNTVLLTKKKFTSNFNVNSEFSYYYNNYDLNFKFTYLGINPQLRYVAPIGKFKPYVGAGFCGNVLLTSSQSMVNTIYRAGYPPQSYKNILPFDEFRTLEFGFNATFGAKYPLNPTRNIFLEGRVESGNGFSPYVGIGTDVSSLTILTGLEF